VERRDIEIISEVLKGNKEKYALLMRKYNQRLYRISKGYLKDEAEIEDVMQETYIKAFQHLSGFENRSEFSTWITRILINECMQRIKKSSRLSQIGYDDEDMEVMNYTDKKNPEMESMNTELKGVLEMSIAQLPEKYRSVFIMREVEKMSVSETCEALDLTESNVKVRLNRAKEMLRYSLMNEYNLESVYEFNLVRCDRIATYVLSRI
jgi:RNA polymerase sigma factor (sigma-70 family)